MECNDRFNDISNRDWTPRSHLAIPADLQIPKPAICPIFLDFVQRYALNLDFKCYSQSHRSFSMLNRPCIRLSTSTVSRLLATHQSHEHWVKPTSDSISERSHLFSLGRVNTDVHLQGIQHLRVIKQDLAHIWVPSSRPLNAQEAIEASMWFRITMNLQPLPPGTMHIAELLFMPVPIINTNGSSPTLSELVQGPVLEVPGFAERMEVLLNAPHSGFTIEQLSANQLDLVDGFKFKTGKDSGFSNYSTAFLEGVKCLAQGMTREDCIAAVSALLLESFGTYRGAPAKATKIATSYIDAVLTRSPKVEGAYKRPEEKRTAQQQQAAKVRAKADEFLSLSPLQRLKLLEANGIDYLLDPKPQP